MSVRSQCHKTTLYKRHEIIRLPTPGQGWQAKQPESGGKRKAAMSAASAAGLRGRQELGIQQLVLLDHTHYHGGRDEVQESHRLASRAFRFHFRVRGPLNYGGERRAARAPDNCLASGLTTAADSCARTAAAAGHNGPVMCDAA